MMAKRVLSGFLATLTPEQQKRALAYRGNDTFGDTRVGLVASAAAVQRPKTLNDYVMRGQTAASLSPTPHSPPDIDPLGR